MLKQMLDVDHIMDRRCGHNRTPEHCPYKYCGYRLALEEIASLKAQLQLADPCGIAKDVLDGKVDALGRPIDRSQLIPIRRRTNPRKAQP